MNNLTRMLLLSALALALVSNTSQTAKLLEGASHRNAIQGGALNAFQLLAADLVSIDRNARDFRLPDQIEWKGRPGSQTQNAVVFGDPSKPGIYVLLLKRGP